jgi:hypothetical protein
VGPSPRQPQVDRMIVKRNVQPQLQQQWQWKQQKRQQQQPWGKDYFQ